MKNDFMLGYNLELLEMQGAKIPLLAPINSHLIVVGGFRLGEKYSGVVLVI